VRLEDLLVPVHQGALLVPVRREVLPVPVDLVDPQNNPPTWMLKSPERLMTTASTPPNLGS